MSLPRADLVYLRRGLVMCLVLAVVAGGVGALVAGGGGAVAGAGAAVLVAAFFSASTLAVSWANSVAPSLVLPVGLVTYAVKILLLGVLLVSLPQTRATLVLAVTVVVGAVAWVGLHALGVWRARILYVQFPGDADEAAPRTGKNRRPSG